VAISSSRSQAISGQVSRSGSTGLPPAGAQPGMDSGQPLPPRCAISGVSAAVEGRRTKDNKPHNCAACRQQAAAAAPPPATVGGEESSAAVVDLLPQLLLDVLGAAELPATATVAATAPAARRFSSSPAGRRMPSMQSNRQADPPACADDPPLFNEAVLCFLVA
jgi:hypothetical protein